MQTIVNLGTGGADLNGQNGSTTSADSNDALFLDWPGDNGGNYVYVSGVTDNTLSVPDEAALDITGDIDIRLFVALEDWNAGSSQDLMGKFNAGSNERSWFVRIASTGVLSFSWSTDGTSGTQETDSSSSAPVVSDGSPLWLRVTLDVDNGSGGYESNFYTSADGSTWTNIGTTVGGSTTSIHSGSSQVQVGARGDEFNPTAMKVYRAQVLDGIGGTTVLDVDCSQITSGADTSFTAATGQTVTINRSTSGRKSVAVVSPVWLFGTDDYMEVADHALLDFGASDSFTVLAIIRWWDDPVSAGRVVSKQGADATVGYSLRNASGVYQIGGYVSDGTNNQGRNALDGAAGDLSMYGERVDRVAQTLVSFANDVFSTDGPTSSVGSPDNGYPLRIGARADTATSFSDMELLAVAIFRRVLTDAELASISAYYQNKVA